MSKATNSKWREILILAAIVLLFRIFYVEILNYLKSDYQFNFAGLLKTIFREYPITLFMAIAGFFSIRRINKLYSWGENPLLRILLFISACVVISLIVSMMYCVPKLRYLSWSELMASGHIEGVFVVTAVLTVTIMGCIDIVLYYLKSHKKALDAEILKKNKARFQYEQLKRQLNPHFLFNSLNVLDYLVHTDSDRASDYIKKLAGVYRYLLSKESDPVVFLEEELEFVNMYIDLLEERFNNGLEISINIEEIYLKTLVVPCSIQLLIENATKHNIISESSPLSVKIYTKDHFICVENNLQLRISSESSTGVGLKNIDGQIRALFNRSIEIYKASDKFIAKLPIIENKENELFFKD